MRSMTRTIRHSLLWPCLFGIAFVVPIAGCANYALVPVSSADDPPKLSTPQLPDTTKVIPLRVDTVDDFLANVGTIPHSETDAITKEISRVATDPHIVDALAKRLLALPVKDIDRHLMILATLGEMQNPLAIKPLMQFIWSDQPLVVEPNPGQGAHLGTSFFSHTGALKARAVEMLAYIGTNEAHAATLEVAARHAGTEVRVAAIDAYLFNHKDSPEAKVELAKAVRPDEAKLIGIPRRTANMDVREFDARVTEFYQRFPEERPQAPIVKGTIENIRQTPPPSSRRLR
jgi:hypothetical protein